MVCIRSQREKEKWLCAKWEQEDFHLDNNQTPQIQNIKRVPKSQENGQKMNWQRQKFKHIRCLQAEMDLQLHAKKKWHTLINLYDAHGTKWTSGYSIQSSNPYQVLVQILYIWTVKTSALKFVEHTEYYRCFQIGGSMPYACMLKCAMLQCGIFQLHYWM